MLALRLLELMLLLSYFTASALTDTECTVCKKVMDDISGIAAEAMQGKSKEEKEASAGRVIDNYCSQQSHMETSERKMCYNLESLRQTAAWAVSVKMTVPRICKKLAKENPDICILATVVKQQALDRQKYHFSESDNGDDLLDYLAEVDPEYYDHMTDRQLDEVVRNYRSGVIFI